MNRLKVKAIDKNQNELSRRNCLSIIFKYYTWIRAHFMSVYQCN